MIAGFQTDAGMPESRPLKQWRLALFWAALGAFSAVAVVPYAFALTHAPRQQPVPVDRWPGTDDPARPPLYAPPGSRERFRTLGTTFGMETLIDIMLE